jgi:hypothetical protein
MRELVRHRWVPAAVLALVVAAVLSVAASRSLAAASGAPAPGAVATAVSAKPATAKPASAKPAAEQREHFIFKQLALTLPFDPALGTTFVWQGDVLNPSATKVGEAGANCGVVKVDSATSTSTAVCNLVFHLPRGELHFSGMIQFFGTTADDMFDLAVVGGTGTHRTARGQAHVAVRVSFAYDVVVKLAA